MLHRSAYLLYDGFDISSELMSLRLLGIPDNSFTRLQFLGKEGSWLTRCLTYRNDTLVSLFCTEDRFFADKGVLIRNINTLTELKFSVDADKQSIYHRKYTVGKQRLPVIRYSRGTKIGFIILSGEMYYNSINSILTVPEGCHEIIICQGEDPAALLRNAARMSEDVYESKPVEKTELSNALDTVYTSIGYEKDPLYLYSLKLLGIKHNFPIITFDDESIVHGALGCKDSEDGSAIDTLLYIRSGGKYADRCKKLYRENFVRGDKAALNSRKRRENLRLARFKFGLCPYCKQNGVWLERTRHSTYACTDCFEDADLPSNIPDNTEQLSDLPLLVMIYLGLDIPMFDDIPGILKGLSKKVLDTEMTALLLYALSVYGLEQRHTVYQRLMSKRNDVGIWQEKDCSPKINAICCAAINKYNNVL
ncbi:MAG: hypothetical protein IKT46_04025 [Clostridia bacterium]|nr:hypothetical protein [Clostridia bacterium]